jgi:hypothetical protein
LAECAGVVADQLTRRSREPPAQRDWTRPQPTFASAPQLPPSANCQLLRGGKNTGDFDYDDILKLAWIHVARTASAIAVNS